MKCPKCGNDIKEGHLYCDKCGEEIRIVPDFDVTSDDKIDIHFTDDIDTTGVLDELSKVETKDIRKDIDNESTKEITLTEQSRDNSIIKALVIAGAICVVIALIGIAINNKVNTFYSIDSQYEKAFAQFENEDYEGSIKTLKHATALDEDDTKTQLLLADNYFMLEKYDESNAVLYKLLEYYPEDPAIVERIVNNYKAKDDYQSINKLLGSDVAVEFKDTYSEYVVEEVEFSVPSGEYDEEQILELSTSDDSIIYYTIDGTEATEAGLLYSEPIVLSDGEYEINAISVNNAGVKSENKKASYKIDAYTPESPIIKTEAGTYNIPEPIEVSYEEFDLCYYTIDGDDPTTEDEMYHGPIPMYIGTHTYKFASISNKGVSSEVESVQITLDLITLVDMDTAKTNLINYMYIKGINGYSYDCEQACSYNDKVYYIINEYSDSEDDRVATGNHYAVDVLTGMTYRAIYNRSTGLYTLEALV